MQPVRGRRRFASGCAPSDYLFGSRLSANANTGIPKRMTRYVAKFGAHFRSTSKNHYSAHQVAVRLTASSTSFGSRLPSGESAITYSGKSSAGRSWLVLITSRQLGPEELPTIAQSAELVCATTSSSSHSSILRKSWRTRYAGNSILYC
jgi:hypothetical protein